MRAAILFVNMLGLSLLASLTVFALVVDPTGILWLVPIAGMVWYMLWFARRLQFE